MIIQSLQGYFIREFLHFLWSLHQVLDLTNPHEYALTLTKCSILQLPVKAVYIEKSCSQSVSEGEATKKTQLGENYIR